MEEDKRQIRKDISFDGFKFWYKDEPIGKIREELQLRCPIPKDVMDAEKMRLADNIMEGII